MPNDFSVIQKYLYDKEYISEPFWIKKPDHISYFNKDGLIAICNEVGYEFKYIISDYPIDLNLFNENTNYIKDSSKGKSCHHTRIVAENLIHSISMEKSIELYEILAQLGIGRQIIAFFQKKINNG